jgi:hypothetical protein
LIAFLTLSNIDETTDKNILKTTDAWRYFIAIPMSLCFVFIAGMLLIIRHDTPMFLISAKRFTDAKKSIAHFSGKNENIKEIYTYLRMSSSKSVNTVTYK